MQAFEEVMAEHKDFLKEEATKLVQARVMPSQPSPTKPAATPKPEKAGHTSSEERKRCRPAASPSSSSDDSEDDFVEVKKRNKSKPEKKRSASRSEPEESDDSDFEEDKRKNKHKENIKPKSSNDKKNIKKEHKNSSKNSDEKHKAKKKDKESAPKKLEVSPEAQRLKDLAKKCGLHIPPACFKGSPDEAELEDRLGKFLLSSGLKVRAMCMCMCLARDFGDYIFCKDTEWLSVLVHI
jgi:hypothetical protein